MNKPYSAYSAALEFIYQQLPMYQRVGGKAFKPGLTNIQEFLAAIGNPEKELTCVHVAGTNGKGSTSHFITAILQAAGHRVGLYTSPHYKDFRERIKINGELVPESFILDFINKYHSAILEIQPSYFNLTVAMAFAFFAEAGTDIAVIETGLGGRLDSTNVIRPILSVITNIGYDHQDVLGDTLPEIAAEKAGIIKPDCPVVIGHTHPETSSVFEAFAKKNNAKIYFADQIYQVSITGTVEDKSLVEVRRNGALYAKDWILDALGVYQEQNLQTTLMSAELLADAYGITPETIAMGLANLKKSTYFIGRWQILQQQPKVIADSGHNKEGFAEAMKQLKLQKGTAHHLVIGFSTGKDHKDLLALLPREANFYWTKPSVPRGLPLADLQKLVQGLGFSGDYFGSVAQAITQALAAASEDDVIFIGGSSFMVADSLECF